MKTNLENYLDYQRKFNRMESIIDSWAVEYNLEKFKPLINDGFSNEDIIEYFAMKLDIFTDKYLLEIEENREPKTVKQVMKEHGGK